MIPSREQIEERGIRIKHFLHNYEDFIELKAKELANKIIVDKIIDRMKAEGFDSKIWQNTVVEGVEITEEEIIIKIKSEYFSESGFDVAIAREAGTKDHKIFPSGFSIDYDKEGRPYLKMSTVLSWIQNGKRLFSKGHEVSGLKSLYIIRNTIRENEGQFRKEFNEAFAKWKRYIFVH